MRPSELPSSSPRNLLLVIDDGVVRESCAMLLQSLRYDVHCAGTPGKGLRKLIEVRPQLIVLEQPSAARETSPMTRRLLRREAGRSAIPLALFGAAPEVEPEDPELTASFPEPVNLDAFLDFVRRCCGRPMSGHAGRQARP